MALNPATQITLTLPTGQQVQVWDETTEAEYTRDGMGSTAHRTILCYWDVYYPIINAIRGGTVIIGGYPVYASAMFYPDAPFLSFKSAKVTMQEGDTGYLIGPNGMVSAKYARIDITFGQLPYVDGQVSYESSIVESVQALVVDNSKNGTLQFADGTPVDSGQNVIFIPTAEIVITRYNNGIIPLSTITPLIGMVNSTTFNVTDQNASFAQYQVKFDGPRSVKRALTNGSYNWDMAYMLSAVMVPGGWNSALYTGSATPANQGTFQPLTWSGTGKPLYGTGVDLNQLYN